MIAFDEQVVGRFELGENVLAAGAGGDVLFARDHLLGTEQALVVSGEEFGVETVVLRGARAEMARECSLEIAIAVVRRHRRLP
jgi:hypothetical protein